jgi:3'-phosphoadenosine 5'-phosphosulfate sulfotransferase (PAPS reductase)/FAD synthetase
MKTVSWFSAGGSSAVATKLLINEIDEIVYQHIDDAHPDTMRFVMDCQNWFNKPINIIQSRYKSVHAAIMATAAYPSGVYVNGPRGASCTRYLKRQLRQEWEYGQIEQLRYVWGMDYQEKHRAERLPFSMPNQIHLFPLIDRKLSKTQVHEIMTASGIKRPAMYDLGYSNNNCVGCVKGGMGYWNKIRVDFPEVFKARAEMERIAGATCINGVYLDELPVDAGRNEPMIMNDCGIFCELLALPGGAA